MRDADLTQLRPDITTIQPGLAASPAEQFQNATLRPILKFQNELLVAVFRDYTEQRKGTFHNLPRLQRLAYIKQAVRNDLKFRSLLVGLVAGHFTLEEWQTFAADRAELTRRAVTMLVQRLQDQVEKI